MPVNYHQVPQRVEELLLILSRCLDYVRGNRLGPGRIPARPAGALAEHARAFSAQGWTKARVEDELTAVINDHYDIELPSIAEKLELINRGRDPHEPPLTIPMPEDRVHILVAGGVAGMALTDGPDARVHGAADGSHRLITPIATNHGMSWMEAPSQH